MSDFAKEIQEHNASRKLNILKGFSEVQDLIEKAVYKDNAENQKLQRVGKQYGNSKDVENSSGKEKQKRAESNQRSHEDMLSQLSYLDKKEISKNSKPGSEEHRKAVKNKFEEKYSKEKKSDDTTSSESPEEKIKQHLQSTSSKDLRKFISNPKSDVKLVNHAKKELTSRGESHEEGEKDKIIDEFTLSYKNSGGETVEKIFRNMSISEAENRISGTDIKLKSEEDDKKGDDKGKEKSNFDKTKSDVNLSKEFEYAVSEEYGIKDKSCHIKDLEEILKEYDFNYMGNTLRTKDTYDVAKTLTEQGWEIEGFISEEDAKKKEKSLSEQKNPKKTSDNVKDSDYRDEEKYNENLKDKLSKVDKSIGDLKKHLNAKK